MQLPAPRHVLSPLERRELLRLAQGSIRHAVASDPPPRFQLDSPALLGSGAVFVSLHKAGALRGCVGALDAAGSLRQNVVDMARQAACNDPRFPPVTPAEVASLAIELSRLGAQHRVLPEEIIPGRHGVCVRLGDARAVLLPQVATRFGWSGLELVEQTCLKAGLPRDAWRDPRAEVKGFEAEVFDDASVGE